MSLFSSLPSEIIWSGLLAGKIVRRPHHLGCASQLVFHRYEEALQTVSPYRPCAAAQDGAHFWELFISIHKHKFLQISKHVVVEPAQILYDASPVFSIASSNNSSPLMQQRSWVRKPSLGGSASFSDTDISLMWADESLSEFCILSTVPLFPADWETRELVNVDEIEDVILGHYFEVSSEDE